VSACCSTYGDVAGAHFDEKIARRPEIRCCMRDPDGHLIEVGQLVRRIDS
jgi:hypothetical protein